MTTLHDPNLRGFASDNYAGVHPEVLEALAEANGGHQIAYGEDVYTRAPAARCSPQPLRRRRPGVPGVQRHRRERAVAAVDAAALGCGGLRRDRAHQHGRERRPGAGRRAQVADGDRAGRQAHAGADRPAGLGLGRRAPRPAAGRVDHPVHRARHPLHRRTRSGRSPIMRTPAGMRLHVDGSRIANAAAALDAAAAGVHHRRRRGRAQLRRHQERPDVRRGRRRAQPEAAPTGCSTCGR